MNPPQTEHNATATKDTPSVPVTWIIRIAGAMAVLIGGFYLVAWLGGWAAEWSAAGAITAKTNMALCLLAAGVALLLLAPPALTRSRRTAGCMLAFFVLLVGALTLSEHLFQYDLGIDQLVAKEGPGAAATASPNRMGPPGSFSLVLLGAGLVVLTFKRRGLAPYFGLAAFLIDLVPAVGFLYGITGFYSRILTGIAWPTVVALLLLSVGLMLARIDVGPASLLMRRDAGGRILRRMLPAVILIPLVLGFIRTQGQLHGLYSSATGTGLLVIALILTFSVILWRSAALLSHSEAVGADAQRAVRRSEERLRLAQTSAGVGIWEWHLDSGKFECTPELEIICGFAKGTFPGTYESFRVLVHPEDLAEVDRLWDAALCAQRSFDLDFRICRPSGEIRWVNCKGAAVYDPGGRPQRAFGVNVDITERKQTERALRDSQNQLASDLNAMTTLQKVGMLIVDERTLELVLGEIVEAAISICKADFGNIQILDPKTSTLRIVVQRGFPQWWIDFWEDVTPGRWACGTALDRGERVIVDDVEQSPIFVNTPALEVQLKAGVRAVQSTPLLSRSGMLVGIFSTHYKTKHRPDDRELRLLDLLARHAADIITRTQAEAALREANAVLELKVQERTAELARRASQLRALAGKLTLSEQRERRRMAKVMHDHLQQILVGAKFRVAILGRAGDDLVRKAAREVEELIDESIRTSRSLTAQLSPPVLHEAGLGAGLEWLARWMADRHGLMVELQVEEGALPLAEDVKVLLFESTRELLFNTVKHARVHAATVDVRRIEHDRLQVTVSDEGQGFEPARISRAGDSEAGFGLFGIREQLELFGGQLEVSSAPGQGSRFILRVPMIDKW